MKGVSGLKAPSISVLRYLQQQLDTPTTSAILSKSFRRQSSLLCSTRCLIKQPQNQRRSSGYGDQRFAHVKHQSQHENRGIARQTFSTSHTFKDNLWSRAVFGRRTPQEGYRDDDLLPLLGLDDNSGLGGRILKPSNELKMRCTEFDENGNVVLVSGEFKKHELIAKYSLLPRDLRKIDSSVLPSILVRPSAILINLLHIRCLIKHNRVLVFDVYGSTDSYAQSLFMYDLEGKLRQKQSSQHADTPLPYEFRALEAVLISVTNGLKASLRASESP